MSKTIILLTEEDINTQEAASGSKHLNIVCENFTINLSKCAIDELLNDLQDHKNSFKENW